MTPIATLSRAAGAALRFEAITIRATSTLGPWLLAISLVLLFPLLHWMALLFVPVFAVGYFFYSIQSIRGGGIGSASILVALSFVLLGVPEVPRHLPEFLLAYTSALWCNRYSLWFAERILQKHPALSPQFSEQHSSAQDFNSFSRQGEGSSGGIADAEVVEISDVEEITPRQISSTGNSANT